MDLGVEGWVLGRGWWEKEEHKDKNPAIQLEQ